MAETDTGLPTAGWYADPRVPKQLRWWDGDGWTNNVHIPDTGTAHPAETTLRPGIADQADDKWEFPEL